MIQIPFPTSSSSIHVQERINFEFETMFETGVDEMSWDDTVSIQTNL